MIELRLDPGLSPADAYAVRMSRVEPPNDLPLLVLQRVATGADGELSVLLHSGLLQPGDYRIDLEPATPPEDPAGHPPHFTLRVVD